MLLFFFISWVVFAQMHIEKKDAYFCIYYYIDLLFKYIYTSLMPFALSAKIFNEPWHRDSGSLNTNYSKISNNIRTDRFKDKKKSKNNTLSYIFII